MMGLAGHVHELEGDEGNLQYSSAVQAVCDWSGFVDTITAYRYRPQNPKNGVVELVGSGDPSVVTEEKVAQACPLTFLTADAPPFLIMHGEFDHFVPEKLR